MSRIANIISKARDTLADPNKQRWSDERLLRLVDEGQLDIAKHARILKAQANLLPSRGIAVYDLPADVWLLTRASYNGSPIPLMTHSEMDDIVSRQVASSNQELVTDRTSPTSDFAIVNMMWELDEGSTVKSLVYDRRNMGEIRFYPIPNNQPTEYFTDLFGVVTSLSGDDYTFSSDFGVVTGLSDPTIAVEVLDVFGVVVGIIETEGVVHIWYIKIPEPLTSINDTPELPAMWDTALKYYVIFNAFGDDYDTRFEAKMNSASNLYQRELALITKTDALDGVRTGKRRTSSYRSGFNE